jgi:hypothetical protein
MTSLQVHEFSMQLFEHDETGALYLRPEVLRVAANSPEGAAAKLLEEQLRPVGEPRNVRAKAWCIGRDGKVLTTMLYRGP